MSAERIDDVALDALAMLDATLRDDNDGLVTILERSDDADHWRGVASMLCEMFAPHLHASHATGYVAWRRQRILDDGVST